MIESENKCFVCSTALEPVNDSEIEGAELCVDCCDGFDAVVRDYLTSSPGGYDLLVDIISEDLTSQESRLKDILKDIIREVIAEK